VFTWKYRSTLTGPVNRLSPRVHDSDGTKE
jgi:hypothetical protein